MIEPSALSGSPKEDTMAPEIFAAWNVHDVEGGII